MQGGLFGARPVPSGGQVVYGILFFVQLWCGLDIQTYMATCSWYGIECQGRTTANGEIYNRFDMTCAHVSAPFNSLVLVRNRGKYVIVRVNDRIPAYYNREVDLSEASFAAIEDCDVGVIDARITLIRVENNEDH